MQFRPADHMENATMRITKKFVREAKKQLLKTMAEVHLMSDAQLLERAKATASYSFHEPTRNDLVAWIMKWAIHDALPDTMCE